MKTPQTAIVIGATGMVGNLLLQQLLQDNAFEKVRILVRKPVTLQHPKLEVQIVNFDDLNDFKQKLGTGDCIFSCIGTTQKNVGNNKELYKKIDYNIPVNAANFGKQQGFTTFVIISSVGASSQSSAFYLKLKGEVEDALEKLNYQHLYIFRPSMILGDRKEHRRGENLLQNISIFLSHFLFGSLKKFRAIQAATIAKAMVNAVKSNDYKTCIYEYTDIIEIARL